MKLKELIIDRENSYSNEMKPLRGRVVLTGETGIQTVYLSASAMNNLIALVATEVGETAKRQAAIAKASMLQSSEEALLIENDGTLKIGAA